MKREELKAVRMIMKIKVEVTRGRPKRDGWI
jgi:hypothetical protein